MIEWSSQAEVQLDAEVLLKFTHALMGIYVWEWFLSVDFDWEFITGKRPFRWPIMFYFANRYILFFALIGILISFDTTTKVNCQAIYIFNQLTGNASVGLASINLGLRTLAVYGNSKTLAIILIIAILGHWSLILQAGVLLKAAWSPEANQCIIISTNNTILAATFIYSMVFDLLVFLLNAYKLGLRKGSTSSMGESRLGRLLFGDGLVYFFVAFLSNLLATVFMLLNLNSIMTVIFNIPAAISSTIVACRVVRRLSTFTNEGAEMFNPGAQLELCRGSRMRPQILKVTSTGNHHIRSGVHVQIAQETYTHTEAIIEQEPPSSNTDIDLNLHYDGKGFEGELDSHDVEAKAVPL
ncbi:hypothetical protein EV368DRAFT_86485 [Lentinula lateritia]|uniref:Uncharacterized protein n=1 Tax=Lentinula aff. lateritia TaxID=2804960 RepID=A0ACC1U7V4_9AGAR|nr:hypothetical protein F5876DRAFT_74522 [Lentinula aff. lateritia]KAJ3848553.1 hypothetical protein EV368DRAFT_86485 [Lentinula lateritia]